MSAAFPQPFEFQPFVQMPTAPTFDAWLTQLQAALSAIQTLPPAKAVKARARAWNAWQTRLIAVMNGGADVPADIDYLRCRAGNSLPGTILLPNTKAMFLREWSDAYIKSISALSDPNDGCPLWFAFGVLGALGFDLSSQLVAAASSDRSSDDGATRTLLSKAPKSSPRKGIIVIRIPAGSITAA